MKTRTIVGVTGSRAEYGLLRPIFAALGADRRVRLRVVVAGMHLSRRHGYSLREIKKDGFAVAHCVRMHSDASTPYHTARALGRGVAGFAKVFRREKPDLVLVLGDRVEALAAVLAAAYMNLPIAHVHGGDRSRGGVDESARHAITKFAHLHFPATKKSEVRLRRLGESRLYQMGSPSVDDLTLAAREKRDDFLPRIGLPRAGYAVFIFHPTTSTEFARAGSQARASLEALEKTGLNVVGIYPNNDAGGEAIIRELRRWAKRPGFWVFRNLPRRDYLNLLRHAEVMVGNSSSGFIDTATFRLPVVNVGSRQSGRERSTNVIDAAATKASVARALRRALAPSFRRRLTRCRNPYGSGCPGAKIAGVLARVALGPALIQKQIRY